MRVAERDFPIALLGGMLAKMSGLVYGEEQGEEGDCDAR